MIPRMQVAVFFMQAQTFRNHLAAKAGMTENGVVTNEMR